jgi:hypothetical protein
MDFSRSVTGEGCSVAYAGVHTSTPTAADGTIFMQDSACDELDIDDSTAEIQAIIGQELNVNSFLTASVAPLGTTVATADALNTFRFFLDPLGDFTYTSASGNTYFRPGTAVPEPSTLVLCGVALLTGVARFRRRRNVP